MKPSQIKHLRSALVGTITDAKEVREHYATDASIYRLTPGAVVYPFDTPDIQKTVAYAHEQALKSKAFGVAVRGGGTNSSGGSLSDGASLVMPAYFNRIKR